MESRKAHNLEIGGSNPPPAINLLKVTLSVYRWSMARVDCNIMMLKKGYCCKNPKGDEPKKHTEGLLVKINSVALSTGR